MEDNTSIDEHLIAEEVFKRPKFLTTLCIMSFIGDSVVLITYIVLTTAILMNIELQELTSDQTSENITDLLFKGSDVRFTWAYLIIVFVCVIISLWGVIKMWKLQKNGYYIVADATALIMGVVHSGFNILTISLSVLFMILYGLNFKHLK